MTSPVPDALRHRAILESAAEFAVIATDQAGRITDWNPGAEQIFGWTAAEMLGQPLDRFFTPEDRASGRPALEMHQALEYGRANDERWHLTHTGHRFWASGEMMPLRTPDGRHIGFLKILRDRTQAHRDGLALEQSVAQLRRAQEAGGVGLFSLSLDDDRLTGTPQFWRIFGLPEGQDQLASVLEACLVPEDRAIASNQQSRLRGVLALDVEYRIRRADTGEQRNITRRAELERDAASRPVRMVGAVQDVTEHRAAQQALRDSAARFHALAAAMPNHAWTATPTGRLDWFNDQIYAYSGAPPGSLQGLGWTRLLHHGDFAAAVARWQAARRSGQAYEAEFRLRRADGQYRWHIARAVPVRDAAGAIVRWIGTNTDIQEQKTTLEALARLNGSLEQQVAARTAERDRLWRLSTDIMLVADFEAVIHAMNPAWSLLLGWEPQALLGQSFLPLVHPEDLEATRAEVARLGRGLNTAHFSNRVRCQNGGYLTISWSAVPDERFLHAVGRDVTAERAAAAALGQAEERLRQSQKMEAVGQLTGGLAHDFNNMLAGISGSLELLQGRLEAGPTEPAQLRALGRYVTAARAGTARAAALTHRLLAFSRRQTLEAVATDVGQLVRGMEELIRRTMGPAITVEVRTEPDLWQTLVDPNQLENALLNLCLNARDAMPHCGRLRIATRNGAPGPENLSEGESVALDVSDDGTGMTPEVMARAFDPFFTTKPLGEGTGLGLSMIYGFVRQSGGQARIRSVPGEGTTVCLHLPRHQGTAQPPAAAHATTTEAAGQGETVLVVDDEPVVRMLVTEVLEELGYRTIEAGDGAAGLAVLRSAVRIDLLVSDVGLPGGMNGRQLADAGRALRPGLPVLFITGYAETAVLGKGQLEVGMRVLAKPFALDVLAARIQGLLAGS